MKEVRWNEAGCGRGGGGERVRGGERGREGEPRAVRMHPGLKKRIGKGRGWPSRYVCRGVGKGRDG